MGDEELRVNADFAARVALDTAAMPWVPSPLAGVERRMLDRVGGEVARATSVVRYAPGSRFSAHEHALGEEFLVLDGVFSDEHGDFPAGSYVRNPPGSRHAPHSDPGCVLFVKLRQFSPDDLRQFVVDTRGADFGAAVQGVRTLALHEFGAERVQMLRLEPGAAVERGQDDGGVELLVLEGSVREGGDTLRAGAWLRLPPGRALAAASEDGALLYLKTGHLRAPG